jgi:predicted NAD-dependent protein-ADP-ribosyltransferase YbiA (DUF1768 family)
MRAIFKGTTLVLVPETGEELTATAAWKAATAGHVLYLQAQAGEGLALTDLGARAEACREPINVVSTSADPAAKLISNFAATPFELDGEAFASVEGFWQGLKYDRPADRRRVAALTGGAALKAGEEQGYGPTVTYGGETIPVGTWGHWQLMEKACRAKFKQHAAAREALLSTGTRPLEHKVRRDSRTIPGVIMTAIWMRIRTELQRGG